MWPNLQRPVNSLMLLQGYVSLSNSKWFLCVDPRCSSHLECAPCKYIHLMVPGYQGIVTISLGTIKLNDTPNHSHSLALKFILFSMFLNLPNAMTL